MHEELEMSQRHAGNSMCLGQLFMNGRKPSIKQDRPYHILADLFSFFFTSGPHFAVDMETGMSPAQYFLYKCKVD